MNIKSTTIGCAVALASAMFAVSVNAQSLNGTAQSQSHSAAASNNAITFEGSNIPDNTPGLGGLVGMGANPCVIGGGAGVVGPGFGVNLGGGRIDDECNTRAEMAALAAIAGNHAAVAHACLQDESMRETLEAVGMCKVNRPVKAKAVKQTPAASTNVEQNTVAEKHASSYLDRCEIADGKIFINYKFGTSTANADRAKQFCLSELGY